MVLERLFGVWTYRSFNNITQHVDDFNELRFEQGELVIEVSNEVGGIRGQLAFRSSPPKQDDARFALSGSFEEVQPLTLKFQGKGIAGTSAEGWVFDYVGYLVPNWSTGVNQSTAIVGSVIRTVFHGERPAGIVGSFIALQHDFLEPRDVIPLPENVLNIVASRQHRLHHTVWHSVRNLWLALDEEKKERIRSLDWQPGSKQNERPAINERGTPIIDNGSGEDFLFMHRKMIVEVNSLLDEPIRGWPTIPVPGSLLIEPDFGTPNPMLRPPGNPDGFMVPPAWLDPEDLATNRRIHVLKTDEYFWTRMRWWDREYKNPHYLRTLSLDQLGSLIEWSVHNDMHMRWSSMPRDPETGAPTPSGREDWDVGAKWDNVKYDFLGEFYSSHVNPVFWRLHGWVDDRIQDWFDAHNEACRGEVELEEINGIQWFKQGKWVKNTSPWSGPIHAHHEVQNMERVNEIIYGSSNTLFQNQTYPNKKLTWFGNIANT